MKKSKGKSKNKGQGLVKNEKKSSGQEQINCAICRFQIKNTHQMLTCSVCKKNAHFGCYNIELKDKNEIFTCDLCKLKKRKRAYCDVCEQYDDKQLLKICKVLAPASSQPIFVHTQCGILSPVIEIEQYSKLQFVKKKQTQKSYNFSECCANSKKCPGVIVQCVQCTSKGHFRCKIVEVGQSENNYMIYKWLDKCERYDFLLHHIIKKKSGIKPLIDPAGKLPKDGQLMICQKHSDEYPWCYCDDWKISNSNNPDKPPDYQCDECDRFIHQPCSGLPPNYPKQFKCQGCKEHDIFKKELKLHELMGQISKVEKGAKFDDAIIRLLNAFPFKYSSALQKRIIQNIKQIEMYFGKRQIMKILEKEGGQKLEKRMFQILLFLAFGEKWKQHENSEIASNLLESGLIKKLNLIKEQEEKILSIITMKLKDKKKSQEHIHLKDALKKFIKEWRNFQASKAGHGFSALAAAIKDIQVKFMNTVEDGQEEQRKFIDLFSRQFGNQIFGLLISKNYSVQLIQVILKKLGRVKLYQLENKQIPEQEYYKLLNDKNINISRQQQGRWNKFLLLYKNEFNDLNVVYSAVKKENNFRKFENSLRDKVAVADAKLLTNVQAEAICNQVCTIGHDSVVLGMKNFLIEQNMLKKKLLKISSQKDCDLTEKKMKYMTKMQQFLIKRKKTLSNRERQSLESFIGKVQFILIIFRKGEALQQFSVQSRMNDQIEDLQNDNRLNIIYEKLFHILDNWDERILSIQYLINQMYSKCVMKRVKFDNQVITQRLTIFLQTITNRISILLNDGQKITTQLLRKLCKILVYFKINHQYPELFELLQIIKKWLSLFSPDQQEVNISTFLQKSDKVSNLLKIVDSKIASGVDSNQVNIISEMNKLCLLRQWCKITQKMSLLHKSKATINAIQLLKGFLDKCCYPQNLYFKKVNDLDIEGKSLNKQVSKFLQKPKITDHLSFHEELKFITNKMTLDEGLSTKHILQNCNLDVFVETQELQNEIKQFELLPVQLGQFAERKSLSELTTLRRKFIDSCFRISKIEQYEKFLRKIYVLKCLNFEGPTTREQYFDLLTVGGAAGIELQKRTHDLYKMYKSIQKAEIELSNSNIKRRNFNNLIPWSEMKFKQIREDLKFDQAQISKLQKARIANNRNREEYFNIRSKKIDLEKLKDLQLELSSSIYNNKDIIVEIGAIRNEVTLAVRRIQQVISYSSPFPQLHVPENVFKTQRRVHENYANFKVTHPTIQKFENDCKNYYRAEQLRLSELNPENYRIYCEICTKISEPGCKIPQFLNSRTNEYLKMFKSAMQAEQLSINLLQQLITQGLQIRRLDSPCKQRVFDTVIQIYEKLNNFTNEKRDEQDNDNNSRRRGYEQSNESQMMESDEEGEDDGEFDSVSQSDFDNDSDDDDEDQENGNGNAKDNNQIVLDSD